MITNTDKPAGSEDSRCLDFLQAIMDNIPDSIFFKDTESRFVRVNKAKAENSKTTAEDMVGKADFDFLPAAQAQRAFEDELSVISTGVPIKNKIEKITHLNGTEAWVSATKIPWYDNSGNIIGTVGISRDITEMIAYEEKLKENAEALKILNENLEEKVRQEVKKRRDQEQLLFQQSRLAAMGEMISIIAHQWISPLNSLSLIIADYAAAVESGTASAQSLTQLVEETTEQIDFMSHTIKDFKDFFEPSKKKFIFSLIEAINSVMSILSALLKHNSIDVFLSVETQTDPKISGYPNEFKQALLNILNNAKDSIVEKRKVMGNERYKGKIEITLFKSGQYYNLTIKDNGTGISNSVKEKIFDLYFTTKGKHSGTGIGLHMAKTIVVDNMNGLILADNHPDGAIFTISVPFDI
ncbi:PAS domain-containing sensor histidine kinase [Candidatus Magnetomonas plexicatena]|uniref:PAS domain-containing sensor histidine kinase n=1 Tax=Candidatus Magnetomonas plexicatena TaxID=2552947 RepID=UPI0011026443|nr:PAS domain-containing protein [Nitrospirales bacterium LBB_01]